MPLRYQEAFVRRRVWGESCREIAAAMNYSSLQYFSRVFHRYIGMTPSEYAASAKLNSEFNETGSKRHSHGPLGQL